MDLAFASVQILVFSIMVYFLCGLVLDAGAFFTFYLIIITGYLGITLFFRTVGCMCPDFDSAIKIAATLITFFVLTSGYLIQWHSEQVWIRWIYWINPLGLGFSAMMTNEFSRINLTCEGTSLIPYGPGYNDISHQVCTLAGSHAGSLKVRGTDYIKTSFDYNTQFLWLYWAIMCVLIGSFLLTNVFLGEYIKWGAGGTSVKYFARDDNERRRLNEELQARRAARTREGEQQRGAELKIESKAVLTWEVRFHDAFDSFRISTDIFLADMQDICYDVPIASGQLRLLKNVYGEIHFRLIMSRV